MKERIEGWPDLLQAYVSLAAGRSAVLPVRDLRRRLGPQLDILRALGAVEPGPPLSIVTCSACYEGHTAEVDYDPATGRSFVFCADAGRVDLADADLATVRCNLRWLLDQLSRSLHVTASPPRKEIVTDAAWLLGDTLVGRTRVSVALAIGISSAAEFDHLVDGLCSRKIIDCGLLLAHGCALPSRLQEHTGFTSIAMADVVCVQEGGIGVDQAAFNAWVRSVVSGKGRLKLTCGRPSVAEQVKYLATAHGKRGLNTLSVVEEARLIRSEWAKHFPDQTQPGISTVRRHLQQIRLEASAHAT